MPTSDPSKRRRDVADYSLRHPERVNARAARYRDANREELAKKQRQYYELHKTEILARRRARKGQNDDQN